MQGIGDLAKGCYSAQSAGFTQFNVNTSGQNSLEFVLTHPLDSVGTLTDEFVPRNFGTDSNGIPSFTHPTISVQPNQVNVGGQVTVDGGYFTFFDPAHIRIAWIDPYATRLGPGRV